MDWLRRVLVLVMHKTPSPNLAAAKRLSPMGPDGSVAKDVNVLSLLYHYDLESELSEHRIAWLTRLDLAEVAAICSALRQQGEIAPTGERRGNGEQPGWTITKKGRHRIAGILGTMGRLTGL